MNYLTPLQISHRTRYGVLPIQTENLLIPFIYHQVTYVKVKGDESVDPS